MVSSKFTKHPRELFFLIINMTLDQMKFFFTKLNPLYHFQEASDHWQDVSVALLTSKSTKLKLLQCLCHSLSRSRGFPLANDAPQPFVTQSGWSGRPLGPSRVRGSRARCVGIPARLFPHVSFGRGWTLTPPWALAAAGRDAFQLAVSFQSCSCVWRLVPRIVTGPLFCLSDRQGQETGRYRPRRDFWKLFHHWPDPTSLPLLSHKNQNAGNLPLLSTLATL